MAEVEDDDNGYYRRIKRDNKGISANDVYNSTTNEFQNCVFHTPSAYHLSYFY